MPIARKYTEFYLIAPDEKPWIAGDVCSSKPKCALIDLYPVAWPESPVDSHCNHRCPVKCETADKDTSGTAPIGRSLPFQFCRPS
ncbi:hypothetical protein TNCV_2427291 [Trichonephila clavipes]|nr:hypothetical protein TNCV_2427291 [Trichonephila clavipes]